MFEVLTQDGAARSELTLPHGKVQTPVFQAVGTYGTVKAMIPGFARCGHANVAG